MPKMLYRIYSSANLCSSLLFDELNFFLLDDLPFYYSTPPIPTEAGVPYIVSIFAENAAGNGTKCNVTDFTDELCKFHCCTKQLNS